MHLLATQDWMEAMLFRVDDYIDKFKHTLQHLAREWYHGLDMTNLVVIGTNSLDISVDTSPPKEETSNTYMKGGDHFPLIQTPMI